MTRQRAKRLLMPFAFLSTCAIALLAVFWPGSRGAHGAARAERRGLSVRWRVQMPARPNAPCRCSVGLIVSDSAGSVTALSAEGRQVWETSFSNCAFEAGAVVTEGLAVVASRQGQVFALRADTGQTVWTQTTDGEFQRAPVTGVIGKETVMWLVSQPDGKLFCLRARDGLVMWQGAPTNRCDGEVAAWQGRLAYGNCDGAIYVFNAVNGRLEGSVMVGSEDQMAGGLLSTDAGILFAGTRQGNLAVVDIKTMTRKALVNVSQGEAFVTPVVAFGNQIAMGTPEGNVVFCSFADQCLKVSGRVAVGAPVDQLLFEGGALYALAGGAVFAWDSPNGRATRLALGDDVRGLTAGRDELLFCVSDQAIACLKGSFK